MFHELLIDKRRYLTAVASERRYLAAAASRRSCSAMPGAFIFGGSGGIATHLSLLTSDNYNYCSPLSPLLRGD